MRDPQQDWISFYEAADAITKHLDCGWAEAKVKLRQACRDALIDTMKAPLDPDRMPHPFWTDVAHRDWREREVDEDGPDADGCKIEVMVKEDDFRRWLNTQPTPAADNRRDAVIRKLLEAGLRPPDRIPWKVFCKKVRDEAACGFSDRTITRAVKRIKSARPKSITLQRVDKRVS